MEATMNHNRYKKLGMNTALMVIGNFASKILTFVLLPMYTYCLSTSEYGISDLITTTINLCIPFLTLTVAEGILRLTLEKNSDKKQIFTVSALIVGAGFLLLSVTMPVWKRLVPFEEYVLYFLAYYLVMVLSNTAQQFTKGLEHVNVFVMSGILTTFATCFFNIVLLLVFHMGIRGYLLAYILGYAVSFLYIFFRERLWNYLVPFSAVDRNVFMEMLVYCIPLIPNSISWWISDSSDRYILEYFFGASAIGIYAIAYKIPSIISILSTILTSAWQISAVDDFGSEESKEFFSDVYQKYASVYVMAASGIILLIKIIAKILFSGEFYEAWKYAMILLIAVVFQAMNGFLGIIYAASKKTKKIFITTIIGAGSNIVLNILLIPSMGALGAAIATMVSYVVVWIMRLADSRKILPIKVNYKVDLTSYVLIGVQCFVTYVEMKHWAVISAVLCLIVIFLNRKVITEVWNLIGNRFYKKER